MASSTACDANGRLSKLSGNKRPKSIMVSFLLQTALISLSGVMAPGAITPATQAAISVPNPLWAITKYLSNYILPVPSEADP
jgi:hypothetical protein